MPPSSLVRLTGGKGLGVGVRRAAAVLRTFTGQCERVGRDQPIGPLKGARPRTISVVRGVAHPCFALGGLKRNRRYADAEEPGQAVLVPFVRHRQAALPLVDTVDRDAEPHRHIKLRPVSLLA